MPSLYRIDADGRMWACADDGGDDERGGVHLANNFSGAREDDLDVAAEEENRTGAPTNPSPASSPNPVASLGQQQQAVGSTAHTSSQRAAAGIGGGLCGSFAAALKPILYCLCRQPPKVVSSPHQRKMSPSDNPSDNPSISPSDNPSMSPSDKCDNDGDCTSGETCQCCGPPARRLTATDNDGNNDGNNDQHGQRELNELPVCTFLRRLVTDDTNEQQGQLRQRQLKRRALEELNKVHEREIYAEEENGTFDERGPDGDANFGDASNHRRLQGTPVESCKLRQCAPSAGKSGKASSPKMTKSPKGSKGSKGTQ